MRHFFMCMIVMGVMNAQAMDAGVGLDFSVLVEQSRSADESKRIAAAHSFADLFGGEDRLIEEGKKANDNERNQAVDVLILFRTRASLLRRLRF